MENGVYYLSIFYFIVMLYPLSFVIKKLFKIIIGEAKEIACLRYSFIAYKKRIAKRILSILVFLFLLVAYLVIVCWVIEGIIFCLTKIQQ